MTTWGVAKSEDPGNQRPSSYCRSVSRMSVDVPMCPGATLFPSAGALHSASSGAPNPSPFPLLTFQLSLRPQLQFCKITGVFRHQPVRFLLHLALTQPAPVQSFEKGDKLLRAVHPKTRPPRESALNSHVLLSSSRYCTVLHMPLQARVTTSHLIPSVPFSPKWLPHRVGPQYS